MKKFTCKCEDSISALQSSNNISAVLSFGHNFIAMHTSDLGISYSSMASRIIWALLNNSAISKYL